MNPSNDICKDCYKRRPNKRKALEHIFTKAKPNINLLSKPFIYLTLGAEELLDVIDLMEVCYFEDIKKIYSFEKLHQKVERAEECLVTKIFNKWHRNSAYRNKVEIIEKAFPRGLSKILTKENTKSKIYFFDDTGWFDEKDAEMLCDLLKNDLIINNDIFLITTSVGDYGWFPIKHKAITQFSRYFYGKMEEKDIDEKIVRDNIVDLYVDFALKLYNEFDRRTNGSKRQFMVEFLGKVKYQDENHTTMGLWAYRFLIGNKRLEIPTNFDLSYIHGLGPQIFININRNDKISS